MTELTSLIERKNIAIVGRTNAGKSTLFNALTEQNNAIVSPIAGTTTDPVTKAAELLPFGPVVLIDTAGFDDETALGDLRAKKTIAAMRRADITLYVTDANDLDKEAYASFCTKAREHLLVINKCHQEQGQQEQLRDLNKQYPEAVLLTDMNEDEMVVLRKKISDILTSLETRDISAIERLLSPGDTAVMVVPIDTEAPKGRLILPQVQMIRQCLDCRVKSVVIRPSELSEVIANHQVDLVITDSQAFEFVAKVVPENIALTSFSMLLAHDKSNFKQLLKGCDAIEDLSEDAKILMLEGCTHNKSHEDIGRYKIPALLKKKTGKEFEFTFCSGYDFPEDLSDFDMVVQCGSCMLNSREVESRTMVLEQEGIPVTNYGILLAYLNGILSRTSQVFKKVEF